MIQNAIVRSLYVVRLSDIPLPTKVTRFIITYARVTS
jgi:hypothetical protein